MTTNKTGKLFEIAVVHINTSHTTTKEHSVIFKHYKLQLTNNTYYCLQQIIIAGYIKQNRSNHNHQQGN